jgi:phosphoserine phosphatase RsbU/P
VPGRARSLRKVCNTAGVADPDYAHVLDALADAAPDRVVDLVAAAAAPLGAGDIRLYLADFQGSALELVPSEGPGDGDEADVAGSLAGRAYRTGEPVIAPCDRSATIWVPVVERGERTGAMGLTVPEASPEVVAHCVRLGHFAGLLVRGFARTTDLMHLHRRRQPMTLAASMQWDLLPPLTVRCAEAMACGRLEPAYAIAGDAFDYVVNDGSLDAGLFDGMGHGVASTLMTTLAVGAYRHARRSGTGLDATRASIDAAIAERYQGEAFVTGALVRLELSTGLLQWTSAGHPAPLLLRGRRFVRELRCAPSLPFGLGGGCAEVATEALEPGDCALYFTDGVVEGRGPAGEEFGVERLVNAWDRHAASELALDEILRRLVDDVVSHSAGKLRDDASLMLVCWRPSA